MNYLFCCCGLEGDTEGTGTKSHDPPVDDEERERRRQERLNAMEERGVGAQPKGKSRSSGIDPRKVGMDKSVYN